MCSAPREVMTRLLLLLLLAAAALHRAGADEWTSEQYHCALTIPTNESWTAGIRQPLPGGKVFFHAISMESGRGIVAAIVPELPSTDLRDPEVLKKVQEAIEAQGWTIDSGLEITWRDRQAAQLIARKKDKIAGNLIGVIRALVRAGDLYVVTAYGKGDASRAEDEDFMRVMNSFRFVERKERDGATTNEINVKFYHGGMIATLVAVVALVGAFAFTMYASREQATEIE